PGQTTTNFTVAVNGDTQAERDESFLVQLSNPVNATLARSNAVGTILTDESAPLVSLVSYRLVAESQSPANGIVDPGETVTLSIALRNLGSGNTTNLVATLLPGNGVVSASGPQTYGILLAGGPPVSQPFTFTAGVANCGTVNAQFQLRDGSVNLSTQTLSLNV